LKNVSLITRHRFILLSIWDLQGILSFNVFSITFTT